VHELLDLVGSVVQGDLLAPSARLPHLQAGIEQPLEERQPFDGVAGQAGPLGHEQADERERTSLDSFEQRPEPRPLGELRARDAVVNELGHHAPASGLGELAALG